MRPHLYSSRAFMIKIQRNSKKKNRTTIWLLPAIRAESWASSLFSSSSKIEKLLLRCVIILILKIHYSTTEILSLSRTQNTHPNCSLLPQLLNDFTRRAIKKNLIWNKSRNTFFIADNSNALLFWSSGCIWNYHGKNNAHPLMLFWSMMMIRISFSPPRNFFFPPSYFSP